MTNLSRRLMDSGVRISFFMDWLGFMFFLSAKLDAGESSNCGTACPCFRRSLAIIFRVFSVVQSCISELAGSEQQERFIERRSCADPLIVELKISPPQAILHPCQ